MPTRGRIGELTDTGRGCGAFSVDWRIPEFLSLGGSGEGCYGSPPFSCCGGVWLLRIHPRGLGWGSPSHFVSLTLHRLDPGRPETLDVMLGIRRAEGVEKRMVRRKQRFSRDEDNVCVWNRFCSRTYLKQLGSRLMPDKDLIIAVDMKIDEISLARDASTLMEETAAGVNLPPEMQDTSTQTEKFEDEIAIEGNQLSDNQGGEKALEDFGKLLDSGENSDVTIQLGDVEFKVHSFVLLARCPALFESLQHETKQKTSRKIVVEDCHPGAFRDFLHYLYTGSVQSLSKPIAIALHRIADKYLAEDLKLHCLEHMRNTLSVETFCDSVKLALSYGEEDLLQKAIDFAAETFDP